MFKTIVITPPATEIATLAEAKDQLRLTSGFTADDNYITALIPAARERVEEFCNRYFTTQTIAMVVNSGFPVSDFLTFPYPDAASISSIKYWDYDNTETTIDSGDYSFDAERQFIINSNGWPSDAVQYRIEFVTGAPANIDAAKQATLMIVTDLYENRTETVVGTIVANNPAVRALLYPYRERLGI